MHTFAGCNGIIFESLDVESSFSHTCYISKEHGSNLYMNIIRSRSRSQERKRSKMHIPTM